MTDHNSDVMSRLSADVLDLVRAGMPFELIVLDADDVARMLKGIHPSSVSKMVSRGKLQAFRTGPEDGTLRITLAQLLDYVREQTKHGGSVVRKLPANHHAKRAQIRSVPAPVEREPWDAA